jgi:hypothetical protein
MKILTYENTHIHVYTQLYIYMNIRICRHIHICMYRGHNKLEFVQWKGEEKNILYNDKIIFIYIYIYIYIDIFIFIYMFIYVGN